MSTSGTALEERIGRFRRFWDHAATDRPTFGFGIPFPAKSLQEGHRHLRDEGTLDSEDFQPEDFRESYETLFLRWQSVDQDAFWTAVPWNGVPWIEAIMGCRIATSPSGFDALPQNADPDDAGAFIVDPENPWLGKYFRFLEYLAELSAGRFPVGQPIIRGIMDTLGSVMGQEDIMYALFDNPEAVGTGAERTAAFLIRMLEETLHRVPPFHGGTCLGFYNLWAPGPAAWFQDDLSVLFSPDQYRNTCMEVLRTMFSSFPFTLFHLHPASFQHLDLLLEIEELDAIQVNRDLGGPSIREMLPVLKRIQERKSLVIQGILDREDISGIVQDLSPQGLHFTAMVPDFPDAQRLREDLARNYGW